MSGARSRHACAPRQLPQCPTMRRIVVYGADRCAHLFCPPGRTATQHRLADLPPEAASGPEPASGGGVARPENRPAAGPRTSCIIRSRHQRSTVGEHLTLTGDHAGILLGVLPPIAHIWKEPDTALENPSPPFHGEMKRLAFYQYDLSAWAIYLFSASAIYVELYPGTSPHRSFGQRAPGAAMSLPQKGCRKIVAKPVLGRLHHICGRAA
jgi:hypothetical protein